MAPGGSSLRVMRGLYFLIIVREFVYLCDNDISIVLQHMKILYLLFLAVVIYLAILPVECRCPKCHCGRKIVAKTGKAVNGNPYSVQVCSNARYGCDYMETVFINLNAKHFTPQRRKVGF